MLTLPLSVLERLRAAYDALCPLVAINAHRYSALMTRPDPEVGPSHGSSVRTQAVSLPFVPSFRRSFIPTFNKAVHEASIRRLFVDHEHDHLRARPVLVVFLATN